MGKTACSLCVSSLGLGVVFMVPEKEGWGADLSSPVLGTADQAFKEGEQKEKEGILQLRSAPTPPNPVHWHHRPQPSATSICVCGQVPAGWELCSVTCVRTGSMGDVCRYPPPQFPEGPVPPHPHLLAWWEWDTKFLCPLHVIGAHAWRPSWHCW